MEQSGNNGARQEFLANSEWSVDMKVIQGSGLAKFNRHIELCRPIAEWCQSLDTARPDDDVTAWFYVAVDKVVRHPDFTVDDLRQVLTANWFDFAEGPGAAEQIEAICASAHDVRRYIETIGQVEKREPVAKSGLKVVSDHPVH
jgi:hypothetical protein